MIILELETFDTEVLETEQHLPLHALSSVYLNMEH